MWKKIWKFRKTVYFMIVGVTVTLFCGYFVLITDSLQLLSYQNFVHKNLFSDKHKNIVDYEAGEHITWLLRREEILKNSSHRKLLLFCYFRGGSTFFSEFFRQNDDVTFWFEPLDAFYSSVYGLETWHPLQDLFWLEKPNSTYQFRISPKWERDQMASLSHDIWSCNHNSLPTELLSHLGIAYSNLKPYQKCLRKQGYFASAVIDCRSNVEKICSGSLANSLLNGCPEIIKKLSKSLLANNTFNHMKIQEIVHEKHINSSSLQWRKYQEFYNYFQCINKTRHQFTEPCLSTLNSQCENSTLIVYKGLRLTMKNLEAMLKKDPDLHVIYFVRDPRSITSSRVELSLTHRDSRNNPIKESQYLCHKMLYDYKGYLNLRAKYPNAIKLIRYEDLCRNRYKVIEDVYRFIGMEIHDSVYEWVKNNAKVNVSGHSFSTDRKNSLDSINKWRTKTTPNEQQAMTENCKEVLHLLNYEKSKEFIKSL